MVSVTVGIPNEVIENVRDVLERPVVPGVGIGKEVMAECFQNKERTFDKRIVASQVKIVPKKLALERWKVDASTEENE
jgi:hypothetical protein